MARKKKPSQMEIKEAIKQAELLEIRQRELLGYYNDSNTNRRLYILKKLKEGATQQGKFLDIATKANKNP